MVSFHGLWSLAGLTGVGLSIGMVSMRISPLGNFMLVSFLSLVIFAANCLRLMPRDHRNKIVELKSGLPKKHMVFEPYILILGVIGFGCLACEGAMYNWCAVYFENVIHPNADWVRSGYVGYMLAITCCRFTADRLVRCWGPLRIIQTAGVLMISGILLLTVCPGLAISTLGCMIVGLGTAAVVPVCFSLAGKSRKVSPPAAIATVSTVAYLGFLIAPPAVGFMAELWNLRWAMAVIGFLAFSATLLAGKLKRK